MPSKPKYLSEGSIRRASFQECLPLLKRLWPHNSEIYPIENTAGTITYKGAEFTKIQVSYVAFELESALLATTHIYNVSDEELRIRGTYVHPQLRGKNIGKMLVEYCLQDFRQFQFIHTFAREGTQGFYEKMGLRECEKMRYSEGNPHGYIKMRGSV